MKKSQTSAAWGLSSVFALAVELAIFPGAPTFAGCTWTWDGDHDPPGWYVHCSFTDDIFIEGTEGPGGSGGGGACSNCVGMTSEECNAIKSTILERCDGIESRVSSLNQNIIEARYYLDAVVAEVEAIRAEGDQFEGGFTSVGSVPGVLGNGGKYDYLINTAQGPYLSLPGGTNSSNDIRILIGGVNSIYNYYQSSISGFLQSVDDIISSANGQLDDASYTADEIGVESTDIRRVANNMNCSACSGSGDGSSGGGTGTPGDGGCPCAEYIRAVEAAVVANGSTLSSLLSSVNLSKNTLEQILSKLTEIKAVLDNIKDDVYKIRQTTDLMDDFYRDDTSLNFFKLIEHTLTLSNAVFSIPTLPPIKIYEDYTNATSFMMDGGTSRDWRDWGATVNTPSS